MLARIASAGLCVLLTSSLPARAQEPPAAKDCTTHFTVEGNFLTGKKYSTWIELADVTKPDAYSRVYASIAKDGWSITSSDKDAGTISAAQSVSYGKGSQAPMVVVVESAAHGSKLTVTFRTGGGQSAKEDTVKSKLCTYLGAASSS